ncbi:MAG: glycosyltransferase family 2 protein [Nanoarchaeota archaeon]|nr:glycosyltransferase family 2 protein [Nanoarchaeota archaeon]
MEPLTVLYLFYSFIAFYFLFLYILVYSQNRKDLYEYIKPNKNYSLSIVVPCFNEADSIGKNIKGLLDSNYKGLKKIYIVDDCSTDNSFEIIKEYAKKYSKVIALKTPKNTGRAAGAKIYGAKFVKTKLIGFSDADSFPSKDAIEKMVGYFNDEKTGAVTSRVLVFNRVNYLSRIQAIEYKIIAFTRKLLGFLDSIYVTNGPLSIYRKTAYDDVKGFKLNNLTEDIEITWNIVAHGWKVEMALPAKVTTVVPEKTGEWFKQRIRWNVGGIQTVYQYRKKIRNTGMLGLFIMPYFIFSWIIGLTGLAFLVYRLTEYFMAKYLVAKYSVAAQVAIIRLDDFSLNPSILFFFGMLLFSLGLAYTITALVHSRGKEYGRPTVKDIFIYSFFYLIMYPPLLIYSFYKFLRGKETW